MNKLAAIAIASAVAAVSSVALADSPYAKGQGAIDHTAVNVHVARATQALALGSSVGNGDSPYANGQGATAQPVAKIHLARATERLAVGSSVEGGDSPYANRQVPAGAVASTGSELNPIAAVGDRLVHRAEPGNMVRVGYHGQGQLPRAAARRTDRHNEAPSNPHRYLWH